MGWSSIWPTGDRSLSSTSLILAGVIVSAILSAAIGFLKFLADEQVGVDYLLAHGQPGRLFLVQSGPAGSDRSLRHPWWGSITVETSISWQPATAPPPHWGINTASGSVQFYSRSLTLMTALAVSVSGIIGFVGPDRAPYAPPHGGGPDNRLLIPLSFFIGGSPAAHRRYLNPGDPAG